MTAADRVPMSERHTLTTERALQHGWEDTDLIDPEKPRIKRDPLAPSRRVIPTARQVLCSRAAPGYPAAVVALEVSCRFA